MFIMIPNLASRGPFLVTFRAQNQIFKSKYKE